MLPRPLVHRKHFYNNDREDGCASNTTKHVFRFTTTDRSNYESNDATQPLLYEPREVLSHYCRNNIMGQAKPKIVIQ